MKRLTDKYDPGGRVGMKPHPGAESPSTPEFPPPPSLAGLIGRPILCRETDNQKTRAGSQGSLFHGRWVKKEKQLIWKSIFFKTDGEMETLTLSQLEGAAPEPHAPADLPSGPRPPARRRTNWAGAGEAARRSDPIAHSRRTRSGDAGGATRAPHAVCSGAEVAAHTAAADRPLLSAQAKSEVVGRMSNAELGKVIDDAKVPVAEVLRICIC